MAVSGAREETGWIGWSRIIFFRLEASGSRNLLAFRVFMPRSEAFLNPKSGIQTHNMKRSQGFEKAVELLGNELDEKPEDLDLLGVRETV